MRDIPADPDSTDEGERSSSDTPVASGFIEVRQALVGLGQVWLAVVSGFGSVLAATHGLAGSSAYLFVSAVAAAVAVVAARAALGTFGYR